MTVTKLDLKVTADAKGAVAGLKPLESSLEGATKAADKLETGLNDLDKSVKIDIKDQALKRTQKDLDRLQADLAHKINMGMDTTQVKKELRKVKGDLAFLEQKPKKIKVAVDVDTKGAKGLKSLKGIGQELTSSLSGATGAMGGLAAAAGPAGIAVAAVAGAALFAVKGINALAQQASGLDQAIGGADAVFKDTSQAMQDFAATADQSAGLSQRAYLEMATVVGAQLKNLGFSLSESALMTTELTQRGADLAATFGGSTTQAVEAIGSALRGEMDPIEKYGISLNQAAVNAKALELGLWDGKGALDKHSKAVSVNALIMEQSADAAGQFARESESLAGQQAKLNAEWTNMTTTLGEGVLPLVTDFATVANYLVQVLGDLTAEGSKLNDVWDKIPGPLQDLGKIAVGVLNPITGLAIGIHEFAGEINDMPLKLAETTKAQQALTKQTNDNAYAMGVAGKAAADLTGELVGMVSGSEEYEKAVGKSLKSLNEMVPALQDFTDEQITGMAITENQADAFNDLVASIKDIQGAVNSSVSSFTDLSDIYKTVTKDGKKAFDAKAFIAEQGKRNKAIKNWRDNLATLADRGLSQSVINNLTSMGVEGGSALVESLANHTSDAELSKIGKNWTFGQTLGQEIGLQVAVAMVDAMDGKLDGLLNGKKIEVAGLKVEIPIEAKIEAAQKKLRELQAEAEKNPKSKTIKADIAEAKAKLAALQAQAEKPAKKTVRVVTAGAAETERELNRLARDRTSTVHVNYVQNTPGEHSGGRVDTTTNSIVPQRLGDTATVAGLRGVSSQAIVLGAGGVARIPTQGTQGTVTQLAPRQVPIKIYLDGAEIADHLQLKAGRLATASSVRRRA